MLAAERPVTVAHDRCCATVAEVRRIETDDVEGIVPEGQGGVVSGNITGAASIMRDRYGTFGSEHELQQSIRQGLRECSRVARSLVIAKLANYVHAQRPFRLTRWAEDELGDAFEIILERRSPTGADPKWGTQRTPRCIDSRFLVWTI